jgi:hypothetical protein
MSNTAERAGRSAANSEWLDYAIRIGFVAYGIVHLLIAFIALQLAFGDNGGKSASQKGALAELAHQPFGKVMVWAVAIGMLLLVIWRALDAVFGHGEKSGGDKLKSRAVSAGKGLLYAVIALSAFKTATGAQSKGGSGSHTITAKVLNWPAGELIVIVVGLAIVGYGGYMAWRGWTEKFREHLDAEGKSGESGKAYILFGRIGYIAKGVSIALVGALFVYAGATHDPKKSGGLDQALHKLLQQPFGQILLILVGIGIACYGLFCFARARHLSE